MRNSVLPTVTESKSPGGGVERTFEHPSYGSVRVSRVQSRGTVLFDSNVLHDHYIVLSFGTAKKFEDGYSQRVHGGAKDLFEVAMTENQFVAMVTRMNMGSGVPCTIQYRQTGPIEMVPGIGVFEDSAARLTRMSEEIPVAVRRQQSERVDALKALLTTLPKKKQDEVSMLLDLILNQSISNLDYGSTTLQEQADKLVTEAKVEIEAHVSGILNQLGVDSIRQLAELSSSVQTTKLLDSDS